MFSSSEVKLFTAGAISKGMDAARDSLPELIGGATAGWLGRRQHERSDSRSDLLRYDSSGRY